MSEKGEGMSVNIKVKGTEIAVTFRLGRVQASNVSAQQFDRTTQQLHF